MGRNLAVARFALPVLLAAAVSGGCAHKELRPGPDVAALGTGSSNGGNSAVDEKTGEVSFLDLVRLPGTIALEPHDMPAYKILRKRLTSSRAYRGVTYMPFVSEVPSTTLFDHVMLAVDALRLRIVMNGAKLPDPGDRGVVVIPSKDRKVARFALQIIKSGELWVDGQLLEKMSDTDIAAFLLHEGLIRLWYFDPSNLETNKREGHVEFGHLPTTDKIADVVNVTFSDSRFARYMPANALASKLCEAGIRVTTEAYPGMMRLPLPGDDARKPEYPQDIWVFENRNCSLRQLKVVGPWSTRELKGELVQELSNMPGGAVDGHSLEGRLHDRADSSFWKDWLFPEYDKDIATRETTALGPHRVPAIRVDGYLDTLPVREVYKGEAAGEGHVPPGKIYFLHAGPANSLWILSDANVAPDEYRLGFSLWKRTKVHLEYSGDGRVIRRE